MQPTRHAILIANADYARDSGFAPLRCPLHDAGAVRDVVADPAHGGFDNVIVLENRSRSDILMTLKDTLDQAARDDLMFIFFSGHGQIDEEGALYLAASNTRKTHLEATGIPSQTISDMIRRSRVSQKALVLDCCYAGAFTKNWKSGDTIIKDRMQDFARSSGTYVLMATGAMSLAEEDPEHGLSILTRHLVDGLRGKADVDRDGIVTISELSSYIYKQVSRLHAQRPTEGGLDIQGDVAISRSGIDTSTEDREKLRQKLLEWVGSDGITPAIFAEASDIISGDMAKLSTSQRRRRDVLMRVVTEPINLGQFHSEWFSAPIDQPTLIRPAVTPRTGPTQQKAEPETTSTKPSVPTPTGPFGGHGWAAILTCALGIAIAAGVLSAILVILTEGRGAIAETIGPNAIGAAVAIGFWRWWTSRDGPLPPSSMFGPAFGPPSVALVGLLAVMLTIGTIVNF